MSANQDFYTIADLLEAIGEANGEWNATQFQIVREACEANGGVAWLGKVNLYNDEDVANPLWSYNAEMDEPRLYNFGADFVIPAQDTALAEMIVARHKTAYTGTNDDYPLVTAILERVIALGGHLLIWT